MLCSRFSFQLMMSPIVLFCRWCSFPPFILCRASTLERQTTKETSKTNRNLILTRGVDY